MSTQLSLKEAGRIAVKARLALHSPITERRVRWKTTSATKKKQRRVRGNATSEGVSRLHVNPAISNDITIGKPNIDTAAAKSNNEAAIQAKFKSRGVLAAKPMPLPTIRWYIVSSLMRATGTLQAAHQCNGTSQNPSLPRNSTKGRGRGVQGRGKLGALFAATQPSSELQGGSLEARGGAQGGKGYGEGKKIVTGRGAGSSKEARMSSIFVKPATWVALTISLQNRQSPPLLRPST